MIFNILYEHSTHKICMEKYGIALISCFNNALALFNRMFILFATVGSFLRADWVMLLDQEE